MAVDGSGNVFVTGQSYTNSNSGSDYATIKYSGAGAPLWTNRYIGPLNYDDSTRALAVDGSGNVFVTGESYGSDGYTDYATFMYSGAGVPLWINRSGRKPVAGRRHEFRSLAPPFNAEPLTNIRGAPRKPALRWKVKLRTHSANSYPNSADFQIQHIHRPWVKRTVIMSFLSTGMTHR